MINKKIKKKPNQKQLILIMDYMQKRINQIDELRKELKAKYPDLLT